MLPYGKGSSLVSSGIWAEHRCSTFDHQTRSHAHVDPESELLPCRGIDHREQVCHLRRSRARPRSFLGRIRRATLNIPSAQTARQVHIQSEIPAECRATRLGRPNILLPLPPMERRAFLRKTSSQAPSLRGGYDDAPPAPPRQVMRLAWGLRQYQRVARPLRETRDPQSPSRIQRCPRVSQTKNRDKS